MYVNVTDISQNSVQLGLTQTRKLFRTEVNSLSHLVSASSPHLYHFHLSEDQFHLLTHHLANGCLSHWTVMALLFQYSTHHWLVTISVFYSLNSQWRESDWSRSSSQVKSHQLKVWLDLNQPMDWLPSWSPYQVQSAMAERWWDHMWYAGCPVLLGISLFQIKYKERNKLCLALANLNP